MLRRDLLKSLTLGIAAAPALRAIPLQAANYAHEMLEREKAAQGEYKPKFFSAHQYKTLQGLCGAILPQDEHSGGAIEAGAPEFIDLLTSENSDFRLKLGGGLMRLDAVCADRFARSYLKCAEDQKKQMLDAIAYRKNALSDPGVSQLIEFFSLLRNLTLDGYFTSKIGINYLGYIGNTTLREFPGCPDVPGE
jgi:gluconate 2-dehydrogenase gamma chain